MSNVSRNDVIGYGILVSYRRSRARQYNNQVLLKLVSSGLGKVDNLIGCKVLIRDSKGNEYRGKVIGVHGKGVNGVVLVRFRRNIPGQLLGARAYVYT